MSLQRSCPINTLQRITSSFKHFEKKLDKLQEDVNYHGHTLSELRVMVANLSAGSMMMPNLNDSLKRPVNTAIQYDDRFHIEEPPKFRKKNPIQPFSSKLTAKSFEGQKYGIKSIKEPPYRVKTMPSLTKNPGKHFVRHRKPEAPRKTTIRDTVRAQKAIDKNQKKVETKAS